MYKCLRLPFDKVKIDRMCDEKGNNASYVRITYNEFYYYLSYYDLRPVTPNFNSIECIPKNSDLYIIVYKISPNSYRICWLGDCDCIEFRMMDTERNRGKSASLAVLLGLILCTLSIGAYYSSSTDIFVCYVPFLLLSLFGCILTLLNFCHTYSDEFIQFRGLMRKNLMQEKDLFSSVTNLSKSCQHKQDYELNLRLPKELNRRIVTIDSVYRERRKVTVYEPNTGSDLSYSTSYTKCMVNMVCDGEKFTFEYKEASGDPAPFIAKGDKAKLYWYGPEHEVIPSDREDITYGTRLICLHNITTDNFYESRMCNEPGNVFKLSQKGGRDIYNHYSQC